MARRGKGLGKATARKDVKAGPSIVGMSFKSVTKRGGPHRLQPVKTGGTRLPANANMTPNPGDYTGMNAAAAFPRGGFSSKGVKTLDYRRGSTK